MKDPINNDHVKFSAKRTDNATGYEVLRVLPNFCAHSAYFGVGRWYCMPSMGHGLKRIGTLGNRLEIQQVFAFETAVSRISFTEG